MAEEGGAVSYRNWLIDVTDLSYAFLLKTLWKRLTRSLKTIGL